eukprot:4166769-Alexandrium_andersonii.AAC.1
MRVGACPNPIGAGAMGNGWRARHSCASGCASWEKLRDAVSTAGRAETAGVAASAVSSASFSVTTASAAAAAASASA